MTHRGTGPPADAGARRAARPVVCYPPGPSIKADLDELRGRRRRMTLSSTITVPPREARCFHVTGGGAFRIVSIDGPQVGDLNLWSATNMNERFYSGKTRALHGTHVSVGDRLWSCLPYLRPMATIIDDSLSWYGFDADGAGVHDIIGTRCDPYTARLLSGSDYHHCCHSNLTRAVATEYGLDVETAEERVHDVLNVFMCTGFLRDTGQYFMKSSPVRPGDHFEAFAEIDLIAALSACPGGDCGSGHSNDDAPCYPLNVEIFTSSDAWSEPPVSGYDRSHGL